MLTVKHVTPEGESTFGAERVQFVPPRDGRPATVLADQMPLTGGVVYVMNDRGSTVAKHVLEGGR